MDRKFKIALLTNHDDDIYCFRKELIEAFLKTGFEVVISCPDGPKLALLHAMNIRHQEIYIDRRGKNPVRDFQLFRQYCAFMKENKPDVVLCYTMKPNVYAGLAASLHSIPYISNVTGLGSMTKKNPFIRKIIEVLMKCAFRNAHCVFFQNKENMQYALQKKIVTGKCELIPGSGVNTERFTMQPYPSDHEKVIFNYVGRVMKDKGIDDYLAAVACIKGRYPHAEFHVIGFIEETEMRYGEILNAMQARDLLIFHGSQQDVAPFIAKAHATIHPSTYGEGISNVLLETAACARPAITTDNPGCRDTVEDGKTGFIYKGGDQSALIDKIEIFLHMENDDRKEMGLAARRKVKKEFSRDQVVRAYEKEIYEILK